MKLFFAARFVILTVISLFWLGCSSGPEPEPSKPEPAPAVNSASRSFLESVTTALQGVKSFRARMIMTGVPQGPIETRIDYVMPDRVRIVSQGMEMIMIGSTAYSKMPGNDWTTSKLETPFSFDGVRKISEDLNSTTDVKEVGTEVVDGVNTRIYQYLSTLNGQPDSGREGQSGSGGQPGSGGSGVRAPGAGTATAKVWIDDGGLPRKLETQQGGSQLRTTILYYDYNADFSVDPPVK